MVQGPTTGDHWTFAGRTPAVSKYLGLCPHCQAPVKAEDEVCEACRHFVDWPLHLHVSDPLAQEGDETSPTLREWQNLPQQPQKQAGDPDRVGST
jgi:predicted amidophosphoribosyltransferase